MTVRSLTILLLLFHVKLALAAEIFAPENLEDFLKARPSADTRSPDRIDKPARAPSETQVALVASLDAHASFDPQTAVPQTLRGMLAPPSDSPMVESSLQWFETHRELYRMGDPRMELILSRVDTDALGFEHARFRQVHDGLPVYGRELIAHRNAKGVLYAITGNYHPVIGVLSDTRSMTETEAIEKAAEIVGAPPLQVTSTVESIVYPLDSGDAVRAWQVTIKPAQQAAGRRFHRISIFDAATGHALLDYDDVQSSGF